MAAARERIQEEVSSLLGKSFGLAAIETGLLTKEDFFEEPVGRSVLAHVKLEGDLQGDGALLVPIRDAIRIGGTLIMLPDSELDNVISAEEYTEEIEDSYGEIANIICGSLTSTFEELFPKTVRLVRREQEVVVPAKVDPESEEPVAKGLYYVVRGAMALEGSDMGELRLLLPAAAFGLETADPPAQETGTTDRQSVKGQQVREENSRGQEGDQETAAPRKLDVKKQQARIDKLLAACLDRVGEEVGALLGTTFRVKPAKNQLLDKEDLLEQCGGKQVLARLKVRGEGEGEAYLLVGLRDAIYLGGTLIMLPQSELESVMQDETFSEDAEDAYGEVANIIAGVYTAIFEEQYRKNIGFVKTGLETVVPVKIDPDSDAVLPNQLYYLSSGTMQLGDKELGRIQLAFPATLFELETLNQPAQPGESTGNSPGSAEDRAASAIQTQHGAPGGSVVGGGPGDAPPAGSGGQAGQDLGSDMLIFTDDRSEGDHIASLLAGCGHTGRVLSLREPVGNYLSSGISMVFLVMSQVSEQGLSTAIKIKATGIQVPLVAAAPAWTRSAVLRAVKYGATDILVTPAIQEDIEEKLAANLVPLAA